MWKDVKAILLPTKEKNNICLRYDGLLVNKNYPKSNNYTPQALYIISLDEEIKEGDWYVHFNSNTKEYSLFKADNIFNNGNNPNIIDKRPFVYEYWNKKVISTTDSSLIKHDKTPIGENNNGLWKMFPQIPQQFIEEWIVEYNKGNILEEVEAEYEQVKLYIEPQNYQQYISKPKELQFPVTTNINEVFSLKLSEGNYLSLRRKEKRVYSREEVIKLCKSAYTTGTRVDDINYFEWEKQNIK